MAGNKRSEVFPVAGFFEATNFFFYSDLPHLLQALLNPLQKNPAMGPRVLAKRLMTAQWTRKGEGEPR